MAAYATGTIAGVYLTSNGLVGGEPCQAYLLDSAGLGFGLRGSVKYAADGTPKSQVFDVGSKGYQFGVKFTYAPLAMVTLLVAAIKTAMLAGNTFPVSLATDFRTISGNAIWDPAATPTGPTYPGEQRANTSVIKEYTVRLILA